MSTNIIHKKTAVAGRAPNTTNLQYAELAINTVDGKLYTKINDGADRIVELSKDRYKFEVANNSASAYTFDGVGLTASDNPTLYLSRGETYEFHVNATGHPFYIKTAQTTGSTDQYTSGVTGNGTEVGIVSITVPMDAPATLYYICGVHSAMVGTIHVLDDGLQYADFSVSTAAASGNGSLVFDQATGTFTFTPANVPTSTSDLSEGTNLYYTDARVDARIGLASIDDLADVDTATAAPTNGQVLKWNGTNWVPADDIDTTLTLSSASIDDLGDVDTTTIAPTTGQVLKWDGSKWAPADDATSGGAGLDADTLDGQHGTYYLDYNNFTNTPTIPADVSDLTDTTNLLFSGNYNDLTNLPTIPSSIDDLSDVDISTTAPTTGQVLKWDGSKFIPADESGGTGGGGTTYVEMSIQSDSYTGDGSTVAYTISQLVNNDDYVLVILNGVVQDPSTYSVSGTTVTLDAAPSLNDNVELRSFKASSTDVQLRDYKVYKYTIATNTTSVSGPDDNAATLTYDAEFVEVYVNGIRLAAGDDYGAINGTSVSFNETVFAGSVVEVVSLSKTTLFGGLAPIDSDQITISDTSETAVAAYSATAFRTAKFIVQMTRSTSYHSAEILVLHDGVNVYTTEYASIWTTVSLGTIDARLAGGNVELTVTPVNANTVVRTKRLSVEV